jgi:hypothetical protein
MNEQSTRLAQQAVAAAHRCGVSDCPDEQTLIAFADGQLPQVERDAVAARVAACADCAAAVRVALDASAWADDLAADFVRAANSSTVHVLSRARPARRIVSVPLALAASLILIVGAALLLRQSPIIEPLRGGVVIATTPADGEMLPQAPERLAWPCAAAPSATQVELLAADATVRWSGPVIECAVTLPAPTRSALSAGEYLWRVKNAAGESLLGPMSPWCNCRRR